MLVFSAAAETSPTCPNWEKTTVAPLWDPRAGCVASPWYSEGQCIPSAVVLTWLSVRCSLFFFCFLLACQQHIPHGVGPPGEDLRLYFGEPFQWSPGWQQWAAVFSRQSSTAILFLWPQGWWETCCHWCREYISPVGYSNRPAFFSSAY